MNLFNLLTGVKLSLQILKIDADNNTYYGTGCDMAKYRHVAFIGGVLQGEIKTNSLKVQQDSDSGYGTAADLVGTSVSLNTTASTDGFAMTEVTNVQKRYVRPALVVANWTTPTAAFVIGIQYGKTGSHFPETGNTTSETVDAPAEGTA